MSNWGRWGEADEIGTLNVLTPELVRHAASLIRTGKVYSLALPIQSTGVPLFSYRGTPMRLTLVNQADDDFGAPNVGANEDTLMVPSHNGTHMDALSHVHHDGVIYNGYAASTMKTLGGATRCAIDRVPHIVGRAVLLDVSALHGVDSLQAPHIITADELTACADRQGVELRTGDIILVRTGWLGPFMAEECPASMLLQQPGLGVDACRLLGALDVAAVGADNSAVEAIPFDSDELLAVHIELLVRLGIHLLEHLVLDELAADGVDEAMLIVAPLKIKGATGSPINPVAIA